MKPWSYLILTLEQKLEAEEEMKKRIWFHERHREYWEEAEKRKPGKSKESAGKITKLK